jgi:hypothetical protein
MLALVVPPSAVVEYPSIFRRLTTISSLPCRAMLTLANARFSTSASRAVEQILVKSKIIVRNDTEVIFMLRFSGPTIVLKLKVKSKPGELVPGLASTLIVNMSDL